MSCGEINLRFNFKTAVDITRRGFSKSGVGFSRALGIP